MFESFKRHLVELRKLPNQILANKALKKSGVLMAGYQRSGTNMLMEALDKHPLTTVYHEKDQRLFDDYELRDNQTLRHYIRRAHGRVTIVKTLLDIHKYEELNTIFSDYYKDAPLIIWPIRDLNDLVNSHVVRWPDERECVDDILGEDKIETWRGQSLTAQSMTKLKSLYHDSLTVADCKAMGWLMRHEIMFNPSFPRENCLVVIYEDIVTKPVETLAALTKMLGLERNDKMTSHIHKKSIGKNTAPVIDQNIRQACEELRQKILSSNDISVLKV